jgi:hypothetical protein
VIFVLPFIFQGMLMSIDEFYCHRRRELGRWERMGHPLDTVTFLMCLLWILFLPPNDFNLAIYGGLAVASSLFITKDEWQHRVLSTGFENWLHALLFMLHPLMLLSAGWMWWTVHPIFAPVIGGFAALTAAFAIYQAWYWNVWRRGQ